MKEELRKKRKIEHIKYAVDLFNEKQIFDDFNFIHNCLPEIDLDEIDITTDLASIKLKNPIIINAITGGSTEVKTINNYLAIAARETNTAIAVGSQTAALKDASVVSSYKIVRRQNPKGIVFANVNANTSCDDALKAVEMLNADALQIHLNAPQELSMFEGERRFKGWLKNIEKIVSHLPVPIIVKEVGFGISGREARRLSDVGVKIIDIGGKGGTNFIKIEEYRSMQNVDSNISTSFKKWGIPTGISLIETIESTNNSVNIVASGGICNGVNSVKALILGAKAVGIAGHLLYVLKLKGCNGLIVRINEIIQEIKHTMLLIGAKNINQVNYMPIIITGFSAEWLRLKGYNIDKYAQRTGFN